MTSVCFYFQVHQPMRLRRVHAFNAPRDLDYWDHDKNQAILDRVARKCYFPTNTLLRELIEKHEGWFRVAFSLSGVFLEQCQRYRPDILRSFQDLVRTGHVEILDETYYHSLAGLWQDQTEYRAQIQEHRDLVQRLFGQRPTTFRNTELIYDNRIAGTIEALGYNAIMTEGTERILGNRSPTHVYRPARENAALKVLLKHYRLSDDVAFRFSTPTWGEFPLTAEKYATWLAQTPGDTVNLFMDYETFGEHQWPETGIFEFLRHLPREVAKHPHLGFALPREVASAYDAVDTLEVPNAISWADTERDVSAWLHNPMQHHCFETLRTLGQKLNEAGDPDLLHAWRLLQTSDHLYYCCTKFFGDQDIHTYFSPYDSPYIAFANYANVLEDLASKAARLLHA